jgi:ribose/xylose/arabinose/galactoside ABC-type transport system permease subunit
LRRRRLSEEIGILSVWLVVFLAMCLLSDRFRMYSNIRILLLNGSVIAFLALGQAFVLLTGGIDLSTGSTVGMTGVLCAVMMQFGLPWPLASLIALASGAFLGLCNGAIIHYLKIPPFIVTFSTYGVATSVPMIIAEAQSITVADERFSIVGNGEFLTIPSRWCWWELPHSSAISCCNEHDWASIFTPWEVMLKQRDWLE